MPWGLEQTSAYQPVAVMRFLRTTIPWRPLRRRLCAALTLVAYLLATFGCPLPAAAKETDQPFPCQDHPCGCRTAEQCWKRCCCFTPEQRWAWAESHHVQPPAYAEKPASRGWRTTRLRDRDQAPAKSPPACASCAASRTAPGQPPGCSSSCCAHERARPSCCQVPKSGQSTQEGTPGRKGTVRWGLGVSAMGCQGHSTLWVSTGAALPPAPPLTWTPGLAPVGWLSSAPEAALALPAMPLEPPPRFPQA
jgi:hypothetical protein